jgi:hypothetical protein
MGRVEVSCTGVDHALRVATGDYHASGRNNLTCETLAHMGLGHCEAAIDLVEEMFSAPSWFTVHILEIDPVWDPLREHPRFQALLEE